jgi:hypothetical protein
MEQYEIMTTLPQELHPLEHAVAVSEQIGNHHHQSPPRQRLGKRSEHRHEGCRPARTGRLEHLHHAREVRPLRPRRHARPDLVVEDAAAHGVTMRERQPGKAGRERGGVVVFSEWPRGVVHACRTVHEERDAEVGLLFELLHIEAVLPSPDLPVDATQVVATDIFPVLEKLHRLPLVGALVEAGEHALDNSTRAQLQPRDAGNRLRMQILSGTGRHG